MSQSLISAAQKSVTQTKMSGEKPYIPFYGNLPNYAELGTQRHAIPAWLGLPGAPDGNSMTFKFPAGNGLLYEASLGFVCTYTIQAGDILTAPIGFNMIRSIEILSNGQPVVFRTGVAMLAAIKTWKDPQMQVFALKYAKMLKETNELISVAGDTSFLTYLPLLESFLTMAEKAILLNVVTDLQIRVTFNTAAESGLVNGITAIRGTLYCETYSPKLSVMQEIVTNDWSKRLEMEWTNSYTEVSPLGTNTSTTYSITCPFLVYKTHFIIRRVSGATYGAPLYKINDITLNLNGTNYVSGLKKSRLISNGAKYGTSSLTLAVAQDDEVMTIDYGILTGRQQNTGSAFMQELQGTSVTLNYDTVGTAGESRLFVVHETFNNVAFIPGSGSLGHLEISSNN